jgi:GNAT superfamily N-acetyltransferase
MLILPLNNGHDRKGFDCGDADLNRWLAQVAKQHKDKGVSSTFVAVGEPTGAQVLGFYALSLAELINADLPLTHRKRLPAKVPVYRLGRLATAKAHQGQRIGEFLLFDAIDRVTRIAQEVSGAGLVVNAKPGAVAFYQQYGFEPMADHPQHLFLPL